MSGLSRAPQGTRITQALEAIRQFEDRLVDWGSPELAAALGISVQQARALVATLAARGLLTFREATVRKQRLMLAAKPATDSSAAA
jgi:DNA-binding IclR family transcriptional regulator